MPETASRTLSQRCKDDNWDLHQIAERNDGLAVLIRGNLPREAYVGILEQAWVASTALDRAVDAAIANRPELGTIIGADQRFAPYLEEDLAYHGRATDAIVPTPGTTRFVEHIEHHAGDPLYILGLHYVRRGACNGNKFVALKARQHYGLPETGEGTRFLDPFGKAQRDGWVAFKTGLDALGLGPGEQDRVFAGVRAAYEYAISMDNDQRHVPAAELLEIHSATLDREAFAKSHTVVEHHENPGADRPLGLTE